MGSERRERMRVLGARLRTLCADAGLPGAALAERAGVGQPTVSTVETSGTTGSRPGGCGRHGRAALPRSAAHGQQTHWPRRPGPARES
ncbi:helix-turn-helix transcriptional regulator [Streptomyces werraensis]